MYNILLAVVAFFMPLVSIVYAFFGGKYVKIGVSVACFSLATSCSIFGLRAALALVLS